MCKEMRRLSKVCSSKTLSVGEGQGDGDTVKERTRCPTRGKEVADKRQCRGAAGGSRHYCAYGEGVFARRKRVRRPGSGATIG